MNSIPRSNEHSKALFKAFVPDDPRVKVKPMFGNLAGFVNGNMFMGLYGDDLFVRLPTEDHHELLDKGASIFEPMKGRPMKEYVVLPRIWVVRQPDKVRPWVARSLEWAGTLPKKEKKQSTRKGK